MMMFPGLHHSPPNFLTPRYLGRESLVFFTVPPAFFVALKTQTLEPQSYAKASAHQRRCSVHIRVTQEAEVTSRDPGTEAASWKDKSLRGRYGAKPEDAAVRREAS